MSDSGTPKGAKPQPSSITPISPGAAASMSSGGRPLATRPGKQTRTPKTKVGKKTNELLRHPLALPFIMLLAGLLAARILIGVIPLRGSLELDLPLWLAELLSESGDN